MTGFKEQRIEFPCYRKSLREEDEFYEIFFLCSFIQTCCLCNRDSNPNFRFVDLSPIPFLELNQTIKPYLIMFPFFLSGVISNMPLVDPFGSISYQGRPSSISWRLLFFNQPNSIRVNSDL